MDEISILLICWLFQGFIGWIIAKGKGRGAAGFWWSFFLGIIGWVIAACIQPSLEVQGRRMAMQARMIKEAMRESA